MVCFAALGDLLDEEIDARYMEFEYIYIYICIYFIYLYTYIFIYLYMGKKQIPGVKYKQKQHMRTKYM